MKKRTLFLRFILVSLVLCSQQLFAQSYKTFTKTEVLYTNSESLPLANADGWCTDGSGSGTFSFASKGAFYDDPLSGAEVNETVSLLGLKGLGGVKGAVFYVTGITGVDVCFRSGSTVTRYARVDVLDSSNKETQVMGSHDGTSKASVISVANLQKSEKYVITLSGWADEAAAATADCQAIYVKFEVADNSGKAKVAYVYDGSYSTYVGLVSDPVFTALNTQYDVTPFDVSLYNSAAGATYVEYLKNYDLVAISEVIGGTHIFGLACQNLVGEVPVLSTKAFFYTSGRWGWATPVNPTKGAEGWNKVVVAESFKSHSIFNGLTLAADNSLALFDGTAATSNNVQSFTSPATVIASDAMLANNGANGNFAIHEHSQASGKNTYILVPMSFDAIGTMTDDAKTLVVNAAEYLIATKGEYTAPEKVATPLISETEGQVSISCSTPGASIYYALGKSATSASSMAYSKEFTMTSSSTVHAVAVKDGMLSSDEASVDVSVISDPTTVPTLLDPEKLDRGLVAYKAINGILVSWRLLGTEDVFATCFNVYRDNVKLNAAPLHYGSNFLDENGTASSLYKVEVVVDGKVTETTPEVGVWEKGYLNIKLDRPADAVVDGLAYYYVPGDASVGDVDGDGEYEIFLKWDPSNQMDNSLTGYTGNVYIDCYKLDGTKLWRIDLGRNIRAGAHYTQFMIYDLDGDGKAEMACKTAPGTIDGKGNYVLMGSDDPKALYLGTSGKTKGVVTSGPEYLTVFKGLTGEEITTVAYEPSRGSSSDWGKDSYFNRSERYLACVAYLDGKHPSLVMCRGYYQRASLTAYDFDGKTLTKRWARDDKSSGSGCYGEGAHSIAVADVDGDGCDEIIFGSACVNNDGSMLYRTGFGHGDALHVGDLDPDRPGLEIFMVHEEKGSGYPWDSEFRDARTGEVIWGLKQSGQDIGRGMCADMDSTRRGTECWPIKDYTNSSTGENAVFDCEGNQISSKRPSVNFRIYWMDNLYEQVLESGKIDRWLCTPTGGSTNVVDFNTAYGCGNNLIKYTPSLQADIFGDWREEVVLYDEATKSNLMIFPSPYFTPYRMPCLMHDHTYRMATVWQTVAYNQPPHVGYAFADYGQFIQEKISTGINSVTADSDVMNVKASFSDNQLSVAIAGAQCGAAEICLYDISGMMIRKESVHLDGNSVVTMSGMDSLSDGLYMVAVNQSKNSKKVKVIR